MSETIKIQIVDDTPTNRSNPDLEDFFNGTTTPPKKVGPPPLPQFKAGPPPLPSQSGSSGGKAGVKLPGLMDIATEAFPEFALLALASDSAAKAIGMMAKNVSNATDAFATMVGNERAGAGQLGESAASAMRAPAEAIPIIGGAIKAQNDLTDAIIKLPEKMTAAFLKQAEKIAPYSGAIQGANARADVRQIMADFKEGQVMGDSYGRLIDAQSRLDNTVRELVFPIKKFIVEVLADRLELLAAILEKISKGVEVGETLAANLPKIILDVITASPLAAAKDIANTIEEIEKILSKSKENTGDFFDSFFEDGKATKFGGTFAG